ncbi:23S rRNA (guanosine(2251)-2'-O)-methyltransferase RlmB [Spiroplasma platyhelix]|uniref:23S rRNA (Guanosine(2251)-2'-O)-methyltransferase RlmB n=1 Tax=Spiroplasma platyhelix PALS-1 TaxID=1276218 RepID=A0A846TQB9_9MOLU|nr:23S rRNA (guanosine(2251)-2'-O)-methyltransferase RlmB [Spiroplasma platyhelix]MBE4704139.1 putative TrmH family tRNA/rRNA methyltransferase [Spiroplasma platyhelix PALS-1]NKE38510.1 23S rRNA (guanosine(2251)-2'-O)-methyltransferase RlmB [Spiroplasma platyhelix PALS-1]UJB29397.1 23S rRNA (guanosine2251-2'-O)-methyltransferase [Spiroplasma platyhelix PALS-1]
MFSYIYGYHPVLMSLEKDSLVKAKKVLLVAKKHSELLVKLKKLNIPFEYISLEKMNNLLKTTKHQNICLQVADYRYFELDEIFNRAPKHKFYRFLVCDKITDPHNFGSMLRIAAGNDFDCVVILSRNQVQVNSTVAKAAAGALSVVPICQVSNLSNTINFLQQKHFWMLAADKNDQAVNYQDLKYDHHLALIIGSEGEGVSNNILKKADYVVAIPMSEKIESFNASVACGIIANNIYLKTK